MNPNVLKTQSLAPLIPDRLALHEIACDYAEGQFSLKGQCLPVWLIASGSNIAWIETPFENTHEKRLATGLMRTLLEATRAQAYSFVTECWVGAFDGDMTDKERKHWLAFSEKHGVSALPESMRDDALMIISNDRAGGFSVAKYLVTLRKGKGPNFLGPRADETDQLTDMAGPMFNLFDPAQTFKDAARDALARMAAARAAKS